MNTNSISARSILTKQTGGFLTSAPYPFTHTLAAYTGCAFGATTCGMYCYAQHLPNWIWGGGGQPWGSTVLVKENAPELLETTLKRMTAERRRSLRIFMSSSTDPYQPLEATWRLTRRCLEVFARYPDLDLLLIQTRSDLAERDLDLMQCIPYAWLSLTIETDDPAVYTRLRGGPRPGPRFALARAAVAASIKTQIAVSPCLPYSAGFVQALVETGVARVIVDTFVAGDGSGGVRTAKSPFASTMPNDHWRDQDPARRLHAQLQQAGITVLWSAAGFCSIPPRIDSSIQLSVVPSIAGDRSPLLG